MYSVNLIKNLIKQYVGKKINKFVIFPFGVNGIEVKNVLKNCFNLDPCYIVDNELSKYNSEIIDLVELRNIYVNELYVILTIEDDVLNTKLLQILDKFVPQKNLINLHILKEKKIENKNNKYDGSGFLLKDFLPYTYDKKNINKEKIKVRIMHNAPTAWNAISSICQAFDDDSIFDLLVIIGEWMSEKMIAQVSQYGYQHVMWDSYQGKIDQPDILVLGVPFNKVIDGLLDAREFAKLIIMTSWFVVRYSDMNEFWRRQEEGYGVYRPDYYLYDSLLYNEIRKSEFYTDKIIEMGNAKYDGIYQAIQKKDYTGIWEKLRGKKTILWTTTHGVYNGWISKAVTFDVYAKTIFEYARNNPEMGLIFRPSIGLVDEMIQLGYWSENDLNIFRKYCMDSPNVVYDDTDTYDRSFSIADGILTDAFCGISCSALPTLKPICAAFRSKEDIHWHSDLINNYYAAYNKEDIINFFGIIKNEQDPMLELRKKASKKYVKHFDGKNGLRIKEFIKSKYFECDNL